MLSVNRRMAKMAEEFVNVRVAQGALRGRKVTAKAGNSYFSFQGIPYAKPPVGPLRFQVAQPLEPWDGVRDALDEGPSCRQIEWIMKRPYRGDEDCLYINVYTPQLPSANQITKHSVMVWIHGGGFEVGSGDADMYGPEYLVGEDVVVVTFNYRLGIFGFLSFDDGSVPQNVGLKDQVTGLRWVKNNISEFGGDPNNVTIFGESAGAISVHLHVLSPMSKGLFHRAIIQSGHALHSRSIAFEPQELAFNLAKELGSSASNVQELLSFLRTVPARDLVEKLHEYNTKTDHYFVLNEEQITIYRASAKRSFRAVLEKHAPGPGDEVFLPTNPREIMEKQQYNSVPVMIGITSNEGIFVLERIGALQNSENVSSILENVEMLANSLGLGSISKNQVTAIKKFFFEKKRSIETLAEFTSDIFMNRGVEETTKILSDGPSPVFYYNFDFSGKLNVFKHFVKASQLPGATHLDELGYLFATPFFQVPEVAPGSPEGITRKRMLKLWTNFAKTGNPTPHLDPEIGVQWPPFTTQKAEYLNIADTISIQRDLNKERMDFWKKL